jgi:hypothetical protein
MDGVWISSQLRLKRCSNSKKDKPEGVDVDADGALLFSGFCNAFFDRRLCTLWQEPTACPPMAALPWTS